MLNKLGKDLTLLTRALDGAEARHKLLANNIANANTPGYKRTDLPFQEILRRTMASPSAGQLKVTSGKHLPGRGVGQLNLQPVQSSSGSAVRADGNNVDVEAEMAKLAENALLYSTYSELLSRRISGLRSVINEGKR